MESNKVEASSHPWWVLASSKNINSGAKYGAFLYSAAQLEVRM
jgi:hypothetical protein